MQNVLQSHGAHVLSKHFRQDHEVPIQPIRTGTTLHASSAWYRLSLDDMTHRVGTRGKWSLATFGSSLADICLFVFVCIGFPDERAVAATKHGCEQHL
jgi:hypothetical protein